MALTKSQVVQKVTVSESGCWVWQGRYTDQGYAVISQANREVRVHRLTYELWCGPIPDGLELDHLCRVRPCVNPYHLEPVSHQENMRRGHWSLRTACKNGHLFTPDNTYTYRGYRCCRECHRQYERVRQKKLREGLPNRHFKFRTQCPKGHPYDEQNTLTFTRSDGGQGRQCRACNRERYKTWYAKQKQPKDSLQS